MKLNIFLILVISIIGCGSPEKEVIEKNIDLNWSDKVQLDNCTIKYIQLNFNPLLDDKFMGKGIEEFLNSDSVYSLDPIDRKRLIDIVADSSNFSTGECGTFALNAGFVLLKNDTIRGIIELGCGYYQWNFEPWNMNSLDGSLSDLGFEKMTIILDEINSKMIKTNAQHKNKKH